MHGQWTTAGVVLMWLQAYGEPMPRSKMRLQRHSAKDVHVGVGVYVAPGVKCSQNFARTLIEPGISFVSEFRTV